MSRLLRRAALAHRGWRYRWRVDPYEIRWMRRALQPGDLVIDVGAYKGGYTYWMRQEVGATGAVLAFEPQPRLAAYLRRCVEDFRWTNVHIEEAALSSRSGTGALRRPAGGPSPAASLVGASLPGGGKELDVEVQTLDGVLLAHELTERVRLIKCDVEGHELALFEGAARTLNESRPDLLFECELRHLVGHGVEDVFAHLESLGYRGSFFLRGERLDVKEFDPGIHQVEGRRPYTNNFIFTVDRGAR